MQTFSEYAVSLGMQQASPRPAPTLAAASGPQPLLPHLVINSRQRTMSRLRQRFLELRPFDLEGIMKFLDPLDAIDSHPLEQEQARIPTSLTGLVPSHATLGHRG